MNLQILFFGAPIPDPILSIPISDYLYQFYQQHLQRTTTQPNPKKSLAISHGLLPFSISHSGFRFVLTSLSSQKVQTFFFHYQIVFTNVHHTCTLHPHVHTATLGIPGQVHFFHFRDLSPLVVYPGSILIDCAQMRIQKRQISR